jgi:ribonuclease VapC
VLDSYALFAYFGDEEGADIVADLIKRTAEDVSLFLSLINFGEVAYITEREKGTQQAVELKVESVVPVLWLRSIAS